MKEIYDEVKKLSLEVFEPGFQIPYKPSLEDETKCYEFGKAFARRVKEYHATI